MSERPNLVELEYRLLNLTGWERYDHGNSIDAKKMGENGLFTAAAVALATIRNSENAERINTCLAKISNLARFNYSEFPEDHDNAVRELNELLDELT